MQTIAPGVSVAQVALRYTVNANLIFKWLRDPKYRPKPGAGSEEAGLRFLPVEIVAEAKGRLLQRLSPTVASRSNWRVGIGCGSVVGMILRPWRV